jgi:hypothetical protein
MGERVKTVYVAGNGKTYHFSYRERNRGLALDDDCPTASKIIRGRLPYREMTEEEAIRQGYRPCRACTREYHEDRAEGCAQMVAGLIGVVLFLAAAVMAL